jgi:hypothetical protein
MHVRHLGFRGHAPQLSQCFTIARALGEQIFRRLNHIIGVDPKLMITGYVCQCATTTTRRDAARSAAKPQ